MIALFTKVSGEPGPGHLKHIARESGIGVGSKAPMLSPAVMSASRLMPAP